MVGGDSKVLAPGGRPKPPAAGKGRQKGVPNKITKALKDMILGALDDAGGQEYLKRQADENPAAFMTLVGKVLPAEIKADVVKRYSEAE
jgi:hypothetical protein